MRKLHEKESLATIILASILAVSAIMTSFSASSGQVPDFPTFSFLDVAPNPVGVDQYVMVNMWLNLVPPTARGPYGELWEGFEVEVTKPDGTKQTLGPFTSNAVGGAWTQYIPSMVGTYTFQMSFPGQFLNSTDGYGILHTKNFEPSTSPIVELTVQEQPIESKPEIPPPTNYWERPISAENYDWWQVSGNWLGGELGVGTVWGSYNASRRLFNPYTTAPNTAHIVWTRPVAFGGIVGGDFGNMAYYEGMMYEMKFQPPIIMNGRLYYNTPDAPRYGFYCVDLRTGEEIWWHNSTGESVIGDLAGLIYPGITIGQLYNYDSPNQHGVIPYLWGIAGSTWHLYDAFTGNWILSLDNAQIGPVKMSPAGDMLVYILDGTNNWLAMWNSSKAIPPPTKTSPNTEAPGLPGTGDWMWRPHLGATLDWLDGIQWNVTVPAVPGQVIEKLGSGVILATTGSIVFDRSWQMEIGYDIETGQKLWGPINRTLTPGATTWGLMGPMGDGIYTEHKKENMQWYGYDVYTGNQVWGPTEPYTNAWGMYWQGVLGADIAYGNLYTSAFDGMVHAYDLKTGEHLWDYSSGSAGYETPYGHWPFYFMAIADGKIFSATGEHSPDKPLYKGEKLHAIDAETGEAVWTIAGWYEHPAIADGYLVAANAYDGQIYCFGKGKTAITVTAGPEAITHGSSLIIKGSVTDQSPGAKDTPAISDEDMSAWMEHLYMQKPIPAEVTGVEVTIDVIDANGNYRNIGTATSDMSGFYSLDWMPDIPGKYTVIATFTGSESYWSSYAETAFVVDEAREPTPPPEATPAPMTDTYVLGMGTAAVVSIIAIGLVLILMMRKK
jgi:hypothetical protein